MFVSTWIFWTVFIVVVGPWLLFGLWVAYVHALMATAPPKALPFRDPMGERIARERAERQAIIDAPR